MNNQFETDPGSAGVLALMRASCLGVQVLPIHAPSIRAGRNAGDEVIEI